MQKEEEGKEAYLTIRCFLCFLILVRPCSKEG